MSGNYVHFIACSYLFAVSIPSAHLTSNWNFPQITWVATAHELSDKSKFSTYVRTLGPYSKIGIAFNAIFERFGWKRVGMLNVDLGKLKK